jgi:hypothetical protein
MGKYISVELYQRDLLESKQIETSVNFYQTTLRNNAEDSQLHTRRRENLKSH